MDHDGDRKKKLTLLCLAATDKWDCTKCATNLKMNRRNGCTTPHLPGSGFKTVLGIELLTCPHKDVPHHMALWLDAYRSGAAEMGWEASRRASPILVDAGLHLRDTFDRIRAAEMKIATEAARGRSKR